MATHNGQYMTLPLLLLPTPQQLIENPGVFSLDREKLILLTGGQPGRLRFAAQRFERALRENLSLCWESVASSATPPDLIGLTLRVAPEQVTEPQGYTLDITPEKIWVKAHDEGGVFYAISTLIQILEQSGDHLPCLHISDWPDFPIRGVMLDISRDKVPTMDTLKSLVDLLASWKINQFQLYTEHTFAYRKHPEIWSKASPLTGAEILDLDAYCRERYIELVPNQNSFGHMARWLKHPRYASFAEVTTGFQAPWGPVDGPFSLCPVDPGSLALVSEMYDELLPHFSSRTVNVGCDETFDLGQGRSKELCQEKGSGLIYLEFLLKIYQDLKARGCTMQFWGDIVLKHPELIPALPRDVIALDWGYEADYPFDQEAAQFEAAGIPFYVCPGTSSWSSLAGRTDNALGNLLNAAENGLKHGAAGYLITDWGDNGHWQTLPVSFLGFAAGAAYAWALEANRELDLPQALNRHAFHDPTGSLGRAAYHLGNLYKSCGIDWSYSSPLEWILQQPLAKVRAKEKLLKIPFHHILDLLNEIDYSLGYAQGEKPDQPPASTDLVIREFQLTIRMLRHACRRGLLAVEGDLKKSSQQLRSELDQDLKSLMADYQRLWLERNRPGGLSDSLARLEKAGLDYNPVAGENP